MHNWPFLQDMRYLLVRKRRFGCNDEPGNMASKRNTNDTLRTQVSEQDEAAFIDLDLVTDTSEDISPVARTLVLEVSTVSKLWTTVGIFA